MKTRIIGSLILLLVLFGLFVVSGGDTEINQTQDAPAVYVPSSNDAAMKSLNVN